MCMISNTLWLCKHAQNFVSPNFCHACFWHSPLPSFSFTSHPSPIPHVHVFTDKAQTRWVLSLWAQMTTNLIFFFFFHSHCTQCIHPCTQHTCMQCIHTYIPTHPSKYYIMGHTLLLTFSFFVSFSLSCITHNTSACTPNTSARQHIR